MPVDFDVIVDVDACLFPFGKHIGFAWQRAQRRPVERFETAGAAAFQFAKPTIIEPLQKFRDRKIEIGETEELALAQRREDPAFDQSTPASTLALSRGFSRALEHAMP